MKLNMLPDLLSEADWRVTTSQLGHYGYTRNTADFVMPIPGAETFPDGTADAVLKYIHSRPNAGCWQTALLHSGPIPVVFEKSETILWARVELPNLLLVTRGCTADCIMAQVRTLLAGIADDHQNLDALRFQPAYETSVVWELLRELKATRLAEQIGINTQLLSQTISGTTHLCPEQAAQLQKALHKLGRQLSRVSIH